MDWNRHSNLEGCHAFLSASKYSWLNYDDEKLRNAYKNHLATLKGTELHEFASKCIKLKQKLYDTKKTIGMFVNDAIDLDMRSEQVLYYSSLCFGTADAIKLEEDKGLLRVHDLKTGTHKASMPQLEIYAALFCLEYEYNPKELGGFELRIYQNDNITIYNPTRDRIIEVMDKIVKADKVLNEIDD